MRWNDVPSLHKLRGSERNYLRSLGSPRDLRVAYRAFALDCLRQGIEGHDDPTVLRSANPAFVFAGRTRHEKAGSTAEVNLMHGSLP
jgi:hypothetical protein